MGDYTRRLAGELIRQGCPSVALALNDPQVSGPVLESQALEGTLVSVFRLPATMPWPARVQAARRWLAKVDADWLSVQFVPFGFHPKGLCFGLGQQLAAMNGQSSWHVMLHELWLGLGEKSPLKHRLWGALQRRIVLDLLTRLHPRIVHTQADSYRMVLGREKITASILPLFSNIPRTEGDGWHGLLEPLVREAAGQPQARNELYLAGILGRVHPEWNVVEAVDTLLPAVKRCQRRLALVFLGHSQLSSEAAGRLQNGLHNRATVVLAGARPAEEISRMLQALDVGLATSPRQIIQKSGSAAAMLEHGLRLLVTRDDWRLRGADAPLAAPSSRLLSPSQFALLETLPLREVQPPKASGVRIVAERMLADLESSRTTNGSGRH